MTGNDLLMWVWVPSIPFFFVGFHFGLKYFPHFLSLRDEVELSNYAYKMSSYKFAFGAGVMLTVVAYGVILVAISLIYSTFFPPNTNSVKPTISEIPKPSESTILNTPAAIPPVPNRLPEVTPLKPDMSSDPTQSEPRATSEVTSPLPQTAGPMTKEEIEQLEKEKEYSGNDPIVRQRLGLPPKP